MPRRSDVRVLVLIACAALCGCRAGEDNAAATEPTLTVGAAADLRFVMDDLLAAFRQRDPDANVVVTFGSSGSLYAQLSQQAPIDLFLSADDRYVKRLIDDGNGLADTEFAYARGRLAVMLPKDSPLDVENKGLAALLDPAAQRIAIANPRHAPYGRAAVAALQRAALYEQVKDRLVLGENVAQAAQFVQSGGADVGLVSHSLVTSPGGRETCRSWDVPIDVYPPIEQRGVIPRWAKNLETARRFREFLFSEEGQAIFLAHGFLPPGG